MKRFFALILAALCLVPCLVGCAREDMTIRLNKDGTGALSVTVAIKEAYYEELKDLGVDPFKDKDSFEAEYDGDKYIGVTETKEYASFEEMQTALSELELPSFRAKQIFRWLHKNGVQSFDEMTNISSGLKELLKERFEIIKSEIIPTRKIPQITDEPVIWRYFVDPLKSVLISMQVDANEFVERTVMKINTEMSGAYVFSSGKNMGTFKAVGFPEDVGVFYKLDEYEGYSWTAHGRYPTNTPGWWGGAHPFTLLDYSIVHNGEISSYDANRRFIEMFGYKCTLQTDTEVITYIMDYLLRKQGMTLEEAVSVIAAPFWSTIENKTDLEDKKKHIYLRTLFPSLLITGPFSIVFGFNGGLMALNDRLKLRSMVVGQKADKVYIASEEAAIRIMEPDAEDIWAPAGGEPVIVKIKKDIDI